MPELSAEAQVVSIRPSDAVSHHYRDYGDKSRDHKITGKITLRPFKKVINRLARNKSVVSLEQELTLAIVKDSWTDDDIVCLQQLVEKIDDISLSANNRFLDTILLKVGEYPPEKTDIGYTNIRVWNDAVKNDLAAQAVWCGMSTNLYTQVRIFTWVIKCLDRSREKHLRCTDWGESEKPIRDTVNDFQNWLKFRRTLLESLVAKYGNPSDTAHS